MASKTSTAFIMKSVFVPLVLCVVRLDAQNQSSRVGVFNRIDPPRLFTENKGQWASDIKYATIDGRTHVLFTPKGIAFVEDETPAKTLPPVEVPITPKDGSQIRRVQRFFSFDHPSPKMTIKGENIASTYHNFYIGSDSSHWRDHVPTYGKVVYRNVWDGVDVEYAIKGHRLQQTVTVQHGVNPSIAKLRGPGYSRKSLSVCDVDKRTTAANVSSTSLVLSVKSIDQRTNATIISGEWETYLGGNMRDYISRMELDKRGNVIIAGDSRSPSYPCVNSQDRRIDSTTQCITPVITSLAPTGDSVVFSTFLGFIDGDRGSVMSMRIINNRIYMACPMPYLDTLYYPVLPYGVPNHFLQKESYQTAVLAMTDSGTLFALNGIGQLMPCAIEGDQEGSVYFGGMHFAPNVGDPPFQWLTGRSLVSSMPYPHVSVALLAKLSPTLDTVRYASYVGTSSSVAKTQSVITSMHVDAPDELTIIGSTGGECVTPLNAYQDKPAGLVDMFMAHISLTSARWTFATYFGGSNWDCSAYTHQWIRDGSNIPSFVQTISCGDFWTLIGPDRLIADTRGAFYFTGRTESNDLPILRPFQPQGESTMTSSFLGSFSSNGTMKWVSYYSYPQVHTTVLHSDIDSSGIIHSLVELYTGNDHASYHHVCYDTSGSGVLSDVELRGDSPVKLFKMLPASGGYQYLAGITETDIGTLSGYQKAYGGVLSPTRPSDSFDGYVAMVYAPTPADEYVHCALATEGIAVYDTIRKTVTKSPIVLKARIINVSGARAARNIESTLLLPVGFEFDPPGQSLVQHPASNLQPHDSIVVQWAVRAQDTVAHPTVPEFRVVTSFVNPTVPAGIPPSYTECAWTMPVDVRLVEDVTCTLQSHDTMTVSADGYTIMPNPISCAFALHNRSKEHVEISHLHLRLGNGMGCEMVPFTDTTRTTDPLAPNETRLFTWSIRCKASSAPRTVSLNFETEDLYGNLIANCSMELKVPAVKRIACSATGPAKIIYTPATGAWLPSTIPITLQLESKIDTIQMGVEARIELSKAPHLVLASGETQNRTGLVITKINPVSLAWNLDLKPPVSTTTIDTISLQYRTLTDTAWRSCLVTIPIEVRSSELTCSMAMPDSLHVSGEAYVPTTIRASATVQNIGNDAMKGAAAEVTYPAGLITTTDPVIRSLSSMAPGARDSVGWDFTTKTSHFERLVPVTVIVRDSLGNELTRCSASVFIPRIAGDLTCTMTSPDTIHYDVLSNTHAPDPFNASITLTNHLDTTQTGIETQIDLSHAQHLSLVSGETALKSVPDIAPHQQGMQSYSLTVSKTPDAPVIDTVTIRYHGLIEPTWRECARYILVEGQKRTFAATCAVRGHDTLWADSYYETVIPLPVQVEYALTNTGNAPLQACSAAIVPPTMYRLVSGSDSLQSYGNVAPGETVRRDWLLTVDPTTVQVGTQTIRWVWQCTELSSTPSCTHDVTLLAQSPQGIVVSPWKLHYRAEYNKALPASQQVGIWTGNGASVFWNASPSQIWLNATPLTGTKKTMMDVQPNRTDLTPNTTHQAMIDVTAATYVRPNPIEVEYEIYIVSDVSNAPKPLGATLGESYPNPTSGPTSIEIGVASTQHVTLRLYDLFGREIVRLHDAPLSAGRHVVQWNASVLPAGMYVYVMQAGGHVRTRRMLVR